MPPSLPALSSERKILKVAELTARIRGEIERAFPDLWVEGEIANLKIPASGHVYFTLKDATSQIRAIIFRSHGRFLRFIPKEGQAVLVRGHITLYEARGEYQLVVDYIEPRGAGAFQAAFEALKEKLRAEGLFDLERKRPIPPLPWKIGLITSPTGAALRDLLKVFLREPLPLSILIFPVPVQGEGAGREIAKAIDAANGLGKEAGVRGLGKAEPIGLLDLLILARGGGSQEDLWAFNEEMVARAIARSAIPVISAVGHETDTTIADHVADLRVPTPSVAAETVVRSVTGMLERFGAAKEALTDEMEGRIVADRNRLSYEIRLLADPARRIGHFQAEVDHLAIRLRQSLGRLLSDRRARLVRCRQGLAHLSPVDRLQTFRRRLAELTSGLVEQGDEIVAERRRWLHDWMAQLNVLSPLQILERGYSITRRFPTGEVIRDADAVTLQERLEILLHRGRLICSVEENEKVEGRASGEKSVQ
ncbi:MAG: exodeoxyribonuclease VII large subunit [Candidatus Manganitrophaceae bacterium]